MVRHFYTTLITYLDYFLPILDRNIYSAEKPWVNSRFSTLHQGGSVRALFQVCRFYQGVRQSGLLTKLKDRGIPHCLVKWFHSYLRLRRQTVRVDNQYSDWLYITAGMPQCSPLGLLSFLLLIDDLTVDCLTHKYVDDTTLTELLPVAHSKLTCTLSFSSC